MPIHREKFCILILGMHRSGTSCLAGSLQQQGVHLGEVYEWNPHNQKGNRENPSIMQLNESLLLANQGSWDHPPHHPVHWSTEQAQQREVIIECLATEAKQAWGFKDPRTLINLDFWLDGLKDKHTTQLIGTFRHPLAVAQSLHKRNGTPIEDGLALWYKYNEKLLSTWEQHHFPILSFDVAPAIYSQNFQQACQLLQLDYQAHEHSFFEKQLRSAQDQAPLDVPRLTEAKYLDCYQQLQETYLTWAS
ncbi:MAG: sulfotransferase family protein [Thiothrix sp.]|nr:MAG: sulfotransferase family protein [Thiothrix sp.]